MIPFGAEKYTELVWSTIADYVFEHYGEPIKDAKPLLEVKQIFPKGLTAKQRGILKTLVHRGYFKKEWTIFLFTHYNRTKSPIPKPTYVRKDN